MWTRANPCALKTNGACDEKGQSLEKASQKQRAQTHVFLCHFAFAILKLTTSFVLRMICNTALHNSERELILDSHILA